VHLKRYGDLSQHSPPFPQQIPVSVIVSTSPRLVRIRISTGCTAWSRDEHHSLFFAGLLCYLIRLFVHLHAGQRLGECVPAASSRANYASSAHIIRRDCWGRDKFVLHLEVFLRPCFYLRTLAVSKCMEVQQNNICDRCSRHKQLHELNRRCQVNQSGAADPPPAHAAKRNGRG
jgi:hypothetical protein